MSLLKRLALTVVLTAALMNVMPLLSLLERVPPELMVFAVVAVLLMVAVLVLVFGWRNRSNNRAAAVTQAQRPRRPLPQNFGSGWDRLDEHRRTW